MNKREELTTIVFTHNPDVILVSEILPKNLITAVENIELKLDGYNFYSNITYPDCHRGVCIYVKEHFRTNEVSIVTETKESIWCELKLVNQDKLLIGCIYRSPNSSSENNDHVNNLLKTIVNLGYSHILINGDFNYPEADWTYFESSRGKEHSSSKFLEAIQDSFLFQHVRDPTHYRAEQTPTCLDLILTNEEDMITDLTYGAPLGKSHHVSLTYKYNCYMNENTSFREHLQYYNADYDEMRRYVQSLNLPDKIKNKTAKESWDIIYQQLKITIKNYVPKVKIGLGRLKNHCG